jgi:hypothetical protein
MRAKEGGMGGSANVGYVHSPANCFPIAKDLLLAQYRTHGSRDDVHTSFDRPSSIWHHSAYTGIIVFAGKMFFWPGVLVRTYVVT